VTSIFHTLQLFMPDVFWGKTPAMWWTVLRRWLLFSMISCWFHGGISLQTLYFSIHCHNMSWTHINLKQQLHNHRNVLSTYLVVTQYVVKHASEVISHGGRFCSDKIWINIFGNVARVSWSCITVVLHICSEQLCIFSPHMYCMHILEYGISSS
jgi:hypothetical protein